MGTLKTLIKLEKTKERERNTSTKSNSIDNGTNILLAMAIPILSLIYRPDQLQFISS